MITTVLLDLDDTILADDVASDLAFAATAQHAHAVAGIDPDALIAAVHEHAHRIWETGPFPAWLEGIGTSAIEGLRARFDGDHPNWEIMRGWGPGFRRQSWQQALASLGNADDVLAAELDDLFGEQRGITNPWCQDGEQALRLLAERYQLGMITNGIPDVQRVKIDATGIAPLFDAIVVSGELGVGKPEPAIYQHALDLLGATAGETIMVGDSFRRDVLGSQAHSLRGVWISMGRPQPEPGDPWMVIESLAELPERLTSS